MTLAEISFEITKADRPLIEKVARRALLLDRKSNGKRAACGMDWRMDITATHANGNPLRLSDLLDADDFNFAHDVFGISRHLDRDTGKLTGFFRPRFSQALPDCDHEEDGE